LICVKQFASSGNEFVAKKNLFAAWHRGPRLIMLNAMVEKSVATIQFSLASQVTAARKAESIGLDVKRRVGVIARTIGWSQESSLSPKSLSSSIFWLSN